MDRNDACTERAAAEGTGWMALDGSLGKRGETNALRVYEFAGWLGLLVKPLIWDDIFWQVMGLEIARKPGASRHFRMLNCKVPIIGFVELTGITPKDCANETLGFSEKSMTDFADSALTLSDLLDKAVSHERRYDYVETEVVQHLASGNVTAARSICRDVINDLRTVSFRHNIVHYGKAPRSLRAL